MESCCQDPRTLFCRLSFLTMIAALLSITMYVRYTKRGEYEARETGWPVLALCAILTSRHVNQVFFLLTDNLENQLAHLFLSAYYWVGSIY